MSKTTPEPETWTCARCGREHEVIPYIHDHCGCALGAAARSPDQPATPVLGQMNATVNGVTFPVAAAKLEVDGERIWDTREGGIGIARALGIPQRTPPTLYVDDPCGDDVAGDA